jgi:MoaA/NifB/PqqE/SkfB family radical SAM enzyme
MDKIHIANILLTRKCNLRCNYCSIVRDYSDMPSSYPQMNHYHENELTSDQWIKIINKLYQNNNRVFLIFYGGEPFLYPELDKIIEHCHKINCDYTIISNNTPEVQPKILDLYHKVGSLHGFSASIDPDLAAHYHEFVVKKDHAFIKTLEGFNNLVSLKEKCMAHDVVAEITVTSKNMKYLYDTVKLLSSKGIYSSITTIDLKKSPYYDFSTVTDESLLVQKNTETRSEFFKIMTDDTLLVHIPSMLLKLYNILPCDMKCDIASDVNNVTIDSNGSFRLCLRIKGVYTPNLKLENIFDETGKITSFVKSVMKSDYNEYCKGCNHTCLLMSKYFSSGIVEHT